MLKSNRLTETEFEIVKLLVNGKSQPEIAKAFCITMHTMKKHVTHAYDKIGVSNNIELVHWAVKHGLLVIEVEPKPISWFLKPKPAKQYQQGRVPNRYKLEYSAQVDRREALPL